MFIWNNQDVALSDWVSWLKNEISSAPPSFIPSAVIDYCDCIVDVFNDGAENAFSVLQGDTHFDWMWKRW